MWVVVSELYPHINLENFMDRYFVKKDGTVIAVGPQHDIQSLKDRFTECDVNGKELKKEKPKKSKKKAGK
tara:strand:+ start:427 stop:636 length:210 start_codon:yes stop_codon:yes gene_type:complete